MIRMLSHPSKRKRLKAAALLKKTGETEAFSSPDESEKINLAIHTDYSFSPYSPSLAAYMACKNGLALAGISDHDTLSGAEEFKKATAIFGTEATYGVQLRVRVNFGKPIKLNNFYENNLAFVSIRGIPYPSIKKLNKKLGGVRAARLARDREMTERLNARIKKFGMSVDFEKDVLKNSCYKDGGTVTERHILYAFAKQIVQKYPTAEEIKTFLKEGVNVNTDSRFDLYLSDVKSSYFAYDLVDCIKNEIRFFYVPASDAIELAEAVSLAKEFGGLVTYSYLGNSVRNIDGEEKVFPMEDGNAEEIISFLASSGVDGIECVMPNMTDERLEIIDGLAEKYGMFVLPCCDINSPRQKFDATAFGFTENEDRKKKYIRNLWAVAGHAKSCECSLGDGLNGEKSVQNNPSLEDRLTLYAEIGKLNTKV